MKKQQCVRKPISFFKIYILFDEINSFISVETFKCTLFKAVKSRLSVGKQIEVKMKTKSYFRQERERNRVVKIQKERREKISIEARYLQTGFIDTGLLDIFFKKKVNIVL